MQVKQQQEKYYAERRPSRRVLRNLETNGGVQANLIDSHIPSSFADACVVHMLSYGMLLLPCVMLC